MFSPAPLRVQNLVLNVIGTVEDARTASNNAVIFAADGTVTVQYTKYKTSTYVASLISCFFPHASLTIPFYSAFGFQLLKLNSELATHFSNYYTFVWPHYFPKSSPPIPTNEEPQPFFVRMGGKAVGNMGKLYGDITEKYVGKRLGVTTVRKVLHL